ncbi:hypothetical protein HK102_004968 [Quaeritorhiza haematococci]|nr:hypothetical protein HK102_004968 [Quaeritorhiza haematococci]
MTTYERLLKCPDAQGPILTTELKSRITAFKQRDNLLKGTSDGSISVPSSDRLTPYWQWILCHYSNPLLDVFGSLEFMNTDLIPMGMITSVKSAKIQWD